MYYAPALASLERSGLLILTSLYDPDTEAVKAITRKFPNAKAMASAEQPTQTDLAIVASPPQFHTRQTLHWLDAGVSVLCEKPLCLSVSEALEMVACADRRDRILAVGLIRRFLPAAQMIRTILSRRLLGDVHYVSCFEGGPFKWPARSTSFFERSSGGGVFLDIGSHLIDLITWWLGLPASVSYEDDAVDGVEANCHVTLNYSSGCVVDARLSRDWALPNRYFFECENGWFSWAVPEPEKIDIGFKGSSFVLNGALHDEQIEYSRPTAGRKSPGFEQSFTNQLRNVAVATRGLEPLRVPASHTLDGLRVMEECYGTRTPMRMDWLTESDMLGIGRFTRDT
jgi:myo-inositol 2-dehydrogenase / D-chiro-inositol 1-dehydrogenase